MTDHCPLLLKYRFCNCYMGTEQEFGDSQDEWHGGNWMPYKKTQYELWQLKLPDSQDCILKSTGRIRVFQRYEYRVAGDESPVVIWFNDANYTPNGKLLRTYRLPWDCNVGDMDDDHHPFVAFNESLRSVFLEYERCRGGWQPRIIVGKDD